MLKKYEVAKAKIELDSHADTSVVSDQCLVIHDHKRLVNVFGPDHKAGLKCACVVNVTALSDEPNMSQVFILLIN